MSLHSQGRPDLSLSILLQLRAADVFEFIEAHSLVGGWMGLGMGLRVLLFGWGMGGCGCVLLTEAAAVPGCVAGVWASAAQGTVNGSVGAGC